MTDCMNQMIVDFCAEECARQQSGERSVARYIKAWMAVRDFPLVMMQIDSLAALIEPEKNMHGYRQFSVTFADGSRALPFMLIEHTIENLYNSLTLLSPEEVYQEFETIHPYIDGNGRLGALLYNYLRGSLDEPVMPPEYKRR